MSFIETTRVKAAITDENPHGFIVINAVDMTEQHEVYGADELPGQVVKSSATGMTVVQLRDALAARDIKFPSNANKADLQALLDAGPVA